MSSVVYFAETVQQIVEEETGQLAREVGFIQREWMISGADFVQSLIFGWLQEPEIAYDGLTQVLGRREFSISASGCRSASRRKRPACSSASWSGSVRSRWRSRRSTSRCLSSGVAVILEGSSSITLPPELAEVWRGCGGSAGASSATIKLFVRWDVLRGELYGPGLEQGRCTDPHWSFAAEDLPEGCLYVADLGFFGVQRLTTLAAGGLAYPGIKRYLSVALSPRRCCRHVEAVASSCAASSPSRWARWWSLGPWSPRHMGGSLMRRCSGWPIGRSCRQRATTTAQH